MNITLLKDYTTTASDGYMGATKTTGSKSHGYLSDADLSKAIKQSLQAVLTPELSKSDVKVKKESYSMGRSIYITLRLNKSKYALTRDDYKASVIDEVRQDHYLWLQDGDRQIFHKDYWIMNDDERRKIEEDTAEQQAKWNYDREEHDMSHHNLDREDILNEDGRKIFEVADQVIRAYNYDNSNAQVDYFDTNFYYHLKVEWK